MKYPVTAGSIIGKALDGLGLSGIVARHRVLHQWAEIVDSVIARHARAVKVTGTVLHVVVDSSVWMNELAAAKGVLLQKLNTSLPKGTSGITDIRFQQRSWARSEPEQPAAPRPPAPSDAETRQVKTILEPIANEEVKSLLARILEKDRQLRFRRQNSP